jgi:predicted deacylase
MSETLTVGEFTAEPGSKVVGTQTFEAAGHQVEIPLFLIAGKEPGPTLLVTAGIHGAEYASIAAALDLGRGLEPEGMRGRVIVAPIANMPAFRARSIYVSPLDGLNLNRVFPGQADGTVSEQLAYWLFENLIKQADYYVDLHGGDLIEDLVPFSIYNRCDDGAVEKTSRELAEVFGIEQIVRSYSSGPAFCAASDAGIPSMMAEAGGQGAWPPESLAVFASGMERLMRHLGLLAGPAPGPVATTTLEKFLWLFSEHEGYYYPAVEVGQAVRQGQRTGSITDLAGSVLQIAEAPADGRVLFLVTSLAINEGDPLLAVGA